MFNSSIRQLQNYTKLIYLIPHLGHIFDEGTQLDNQGYVDGEKEMRMNAMKAISDPSERGLFD